MRSALSRIHPLVNGPRFRPSLLVRLAAMFALGGVLVATLLVFGNRALHDAERRLENAVMSVPRHIAGTVRIHVGDPKLNERVLTTLRDVLAA